MKNLVQKLTKKDWNSVTAEHGASGILRISAFISFIIALRLSVIAGASLILILAAISLGIISFGAVILTEFHPTSRVFLFPGAVWHHYHGSNQK